MADGRGGKSRQRGERQNDGCKQLLGNLSVEIGGSGTASALALRAIPTPEPEQILLRLEAAVVTASSTATPTPCRGCGAPRRAVLPCDNLCGVIVGVGSAVDKRALRINQRVVVEPFHFCGECFFCHKGQTNLCEKGAVLGEHGAAAGLQEYLAVDFRMVHPIHDDVPNTVVLSAVAATVASALTRASILPGDSVLIVGSDLHALTAIAFVRCLGADFISMAGFRTVGTAASAAVAAGCGARRFVTLDETDQNDSLVLAELLQQTSGRGFDTVFCPEIILPATAEASCAQECASRNERGLALAMLCVRRGGSIVRARPWSSPASASCQSQNCCPFAAAVLSPAHHQGAGSRTVEGERGRAERCSEDGRGQTGENLTGCLRGGHVGEGCRADSGDAGRFQRHGQLLDRCPARLVTHCGPFQL